MDKVTVISRRQHLVNAVMLWVKHCAENQEHTEFIQKAIEDYVASLSDEDVCFRGMCFQSKALKMAKLIYITRSNDLDVSVCILPFRWKDLMTEIKKRIRDASSMFSR